MDWMALLIEKNYKNNKWNLGKVSGAMIELTISSMLSSILHRIFKSIDSWRVSLLFSVLLGAISIYHVQATMAMWGVYGFSFDDSWIHVQYARTIFEGRAWQYAWGIPSTGSSAPLWSVVIAPIFLFGYEHDVVVTSVLVIAAILYTLDIFLVGRLVFSHTEKWYVAILAQAVFILVPRNAGLMMSGMETPLAMFVLLLTLYFLPKMEWQYDLILGILAGLAYLCRPEFVLLAALCFPIRALWRLKRDGITKRWFFPTVAMFGLAALVVLPWIIHCLQTTGLPLPDSYYSKLRFGVSENDISLWNFFWFTVWFPMEPYLILGFVGGFVLLLKKRPYEFFMVTSLWILYRLTMPGMSLLFAARYLVPLFSLLAISFVAGISIVLETFLTSHQTDEWIRPHERSLLVIFILALLFIPSLPSYYLYVDVHANQTKNIEEMQVTLAMWVRDHIPENATIATYDVGALGFFAKGRVIDIYGLVTPIILHNYTNVLQQAQYLRAINCTYIMFYVEWFVYLRSCIYATNGSVKTLYSVHIDDNVVCGTDNMAVYQIYWL